MKKARIHEIQCNNTDNSKTDRHLIHSNLDLIQWEQQKGYGWHSPADPVSKQSFLMSEERFPQQKQITWNKSTHKRIIQTAMFVYRTFSSFLSLTLHFFHWNKESTLTAWSPLTTKDPEVLWQQKQKRIESITDSISMPHRQLRLNEKWQHTCQAKKQQNLTPQVCLNTTSSYKYMS